MEKRKKVLIFATIILSLAAIVLVVTSLATDYWVQSSPKRTTNTSTEARTSNEVAFGLFNGEKTLDFSFGVRREKISSKFVFIPLSVCLECRVMLCTSHLQPCPPKGRG